ncbi:MAG TPA: TonB-dependent receptor, partial [Pedobacter sp.]|nr:TonB-dependent receptor [Pedobacter sp.]
FSGNADPARVAVTTLFNQGNSIYTNSPYYSFDQFANPELKWETVSQFNTGIDFSVLQGRISGSLDAYLKKASDLFGVVPVDYTTGVGFQIQKNVAKIQGKGLDLVLNSVNTNKLIRWTTDLNFSYHKDVTKAYYNADLRAANFMTQGNTRVSGIPGQAIYGIYAYPWGGLEPATGLPQGYVNGALSKDYRTITGTDTKITDAKYFGSALPLYYGSLGNTLTYKAFSVEARLLFKLGYYFRRSTIDYTILNTQWNGHSDYAMRWQKPGDELQTDIPAMVYPVPGGMSAFYQNAEPFVTKGDHIRVQYITLNYRYVPKEGIKLPFKSINFYSSLSNLGLIWKANKNGIDPDYASGYTIIPPPLTIAAGLRANF